MRIILDTNVLISGIISSGSPPGKIISQWISGDITVIISPSILEEYLGVLLRPKFAKLGSREELYVFICSLVELDNTLMIYPQNDIDIIMNDPDDKKFLSCALEGSAGMIVSGDKHLLELKEFKGIPITSPPEFCK